MGGLETTGNSQASSVLKDYNNLLDYLSFYMLPLAIRAGMTPDQFWYDDPDYLWAYLEAYEQDIRQKFEYDNNVAFLQGQYFMAAMAQVLQFSKTPKRIYPKKPFSVSDDKQIDSKQKLLEYEEQRKAEMKFRCKMFNRK